MAPAAASPLPAIVMVMAALSIFPVSDGIGKYLIAAGVPVTQLVWARYFFHFAAVAPFAFAAHGAAALSPRLVGRQAVRGVFLVLSTVFFFSGLRYLPVADSVAVLFVSPLIVTALAPFVLGERVGLRRYTAVAVGFIGALIVIRPGGGAAGWHALYPLGAGICYAFYLLSTRRMAGRAPPMVTLTYTAIAGTLASSAALPFVWHWPGWIEFLAMAAIGPMAAVGHYMIIRAHERAQASLLAPFSYWQIVMSTIVGYLGFGDFPDRWTWFGTAVLVASGAYVSLREQRLATQRVKAET
jgi:drug/metabolite transporter (DMT)-like permease